MCRRRSAVSLKSRDHWGKAARNDGKVCEQQKTVWARSVTTEETDRGPQRARGGEDRGGGPEPPPQVEQAATLGLLSRAPLPASSPGLLQQACLIHALPRSFPAFQRPPGPPFCAGRGRTPAWCSPVPPLMSPSPRTHCTEVIGSVASRFANEKTKPEKEAPSPA